jgi:hypothetical protein
MKQNENPVCTTDFDLPTPPWGNEWGDPGEPHPAEPGAFEFADIGPARGEPEISADPGPEPGTTDES